MSVRCAPFYLFLTHFSDKDDIISRPDRSQCDASFAIIPRLDQLRGVFQIVLYRRQL